MKTVFLNLKKKWFEKIKSGDKTHEYRLASSHWEKRLRGADIADVRLGYPAARQVERIMRFEIKSISIINGKNTDLAVDADVFDIALGKKLEV